MTMSDIDIGDVMIFAWCLLQLWLVVQYAVGSQWRNSDAGKLIITSFACTVIALAQVSVTLLTDSSYPGRDVVRPIAYGIGCLGTISMIRLLTRMQRKDRDDG